MSIKSRFTAVLSAITGNTEPAPKAPRKGEQTAQLAKARGTIGEHPSKGLTPQKLHQILEGAEDGDITAQSELFADMEEKDGHIFAEMSKRKRALTGLDWRVTAYSAADLTRRGLEVADSEGRLEEVYRVVNKAGDTEPTRAIRLADGRSFMADRGFDGNVGKRHLAQLGQLQMQRAVDLPPRLASMSVNQAFENALLRQAVSNELFKAYKAIELDAAAGMVAAHPKGVPVFVGAVSTEVLDAMASKGLPALQSSIIASSDKLMRHALRNVKNNAGKTLSEQFWRHSVDNLRLPQSVYYDPTGKRRVLLYFYADPNNPDMLHKVVITLDDDKTFARSKNPITGKRDNLVLNIVETGTVINKTGIKWHLYTHLQGVKY